MTLQFYAKSVFIHKNISVSKNQLSISTQFQYQKQFHFKQFNLVHSFIWPINGSLSGDTTPG